MNNKLYDIKLSGKTIAALLKYIPVTEGRKELAAACRAAMAEHDLDEQGNPKPLTVNGVPVFINANRHVYYAKHLPGCGGDAVYDSDWIYATEAELAHIRARKALGAEPKRTCATCRYAYSQHPPRPTPCLRCDNDYALWEPRT